MMTGLPIETGVCPRCFNRAGHSTPVTTLKCMYRHATTELIKAHGKEQGIDEVKAADLLAHLRSVFSDPDAYAAAELAIDLGWRPVVGLVAAGAETDRKALVM